MTLPRGRYFTRYRPVSEIYMGIAAMLTKGAGLVFEDDYTNIEKLSRECIIETKEEGILKEYNGLRNSIVQGYGNLDMGRVVEAMDKIDRLYQVAAKLALIYESIPESDTDTAMGA
ncbi:MAG: HepT-like ribonuclease domain-containing protein [Euryarchaeota archaeon]|nr:HepT-like ribonuclease domain-containing protein [Euryarchaeota archaeon]